MQQESTIKKGKRSRRFVRRLSFVLFGICAFHNPIDRWNPYNILFGILTGLLFGLLFRWFLNGLSGLFNRKLVKEKGKSSIRHATDSGLLFLFPFAMILSVAVFYLNWSVARECICAGIMASGTAASIEIAKVKEKQQIRDTVITSLVSFLFSFIWTASFAYIAGVPSIIQGAVSAVLANMK